MGFLPSIGGKKKDKAAEASASAAAAPGEGDEKKAKESMAVFYTKHGADGKDRGPEYMDKEGDDDLTVGSLDDASSFVKELPTAGGDFRGSGAKSQDHDDEWLPGVILDMDKTLRVYEIAYDSDLKLDEKHVPEERLRLPGSGDNASTAGGGGSSVAGGDDESSVASTASHHFGGDNVGFRIGTKVEVLVVHEVLELSEEQKRHDEELRLKYEWDRLSNVGKVLHLVRKHKTKAYKLMVHYGPPYKDEYGGNLAEECNDPKPSLMDVHGLLNEGGDPRVGNPEDYGNTPLHYAARYCNLKLARMLRKAGAEPNQLNELGQSALSTACMFNAPEPRAKAHRVLVQWLIDHGADVNTVDKGGHTALEMASSWGNMQLVSKLLQNGARVRRELKFLSIMAPSAIDVAETEDVRALLKAKKAKETELILQAERDKKAREKQARLDAELARKKEAIHESILRRRAARAEATRRRNIARKEPALKIDVQAKIEEEKRRRIELLQANEAMHGVWQREGKARWRFNKGVSASNATQANVLEEAGAILTDSKGFEYRGLLQRRWRSMTGLELTKSHPVMQPKASQIALQDLEDDEANASKPLSLTT